jgi:hypothetical protein
MLGEKNTIQGMKKVFLSLLLLYLGISQET